MRTNGSPAPQFETDEDRVSYTIRLPVHPTAARPAGEVTAEVARVLQAIQGDMSRKDIMSALELRHDEHFRNAYLLPALRANLIAMTIPDSPTSRLQRYRLTTEGERLRSNLAKTWSS